MSPHHHFNFLYFYHISLQSMSPTHKALALTFSTFYLFSFDFIIFKARNFLYISLHEKLT